MTHGSLLVPIGPGLTFRFEHLPAPLRLRIETFLAYYVTDPVSPSPSPIRVDAAAPPVGSPAGETLLEEEPLVVRQAGGLILFELPSILTWTHLAEGRAGISLDDPSETEMDLFIGLVLAPMLIELAISRGWLGIHAAGAVVDGIGILLPGPSGAGKSTISESLHRAGHTVLSDDLIWLTSATDETRIYAFPRGAESSTPIPWPTEGDASLRALVCPEIAADGESRLTPMKMPEIMEVLVGQSGFLSSGRAAGDRFRALVRLARSLPGYRLEAGCRRQDVPTLLERLAASQAFQTTTRNLNSSL